MMKYAQKNLLNLKMVQYIILFKNMLIIKESEVIHF